MLTSTRSDRRKQGLLSSQWSRLILMPFPVRLCGVPGAASHGLRQAKRSGPSRIGARGPSSCSFSLCSAGSQSVQCWLPWDWTIFLHSHVWQGRFSEKKKPHFLVKILTHKNKKQLCSWNGLTFQTCDSAEFPWGGLFCWRQTGSPERYQRIPGLQHRHPTLRHRGQRPPEDSGRIPKADATQEEGTGTQEEPLLHWSGAEQQRLSVQFTRSLNLFLILNKLGCILYFY